MLRKCFVASLLTFFALMDSAQAQNFPNNVTPEIDFLGLSRQVVLVLCDDWDSTNGWLQRFNLGESGWKSAAPPVRVSLGRNGLAWGRGLHPLPQDGPQKKEGDGRSPAGVFSLLYVFGKAAPDAVKGIRMPYAQCAASLQCVDDPNSADYNQIVDRATVSQPDWHSFESMSTPDEYRLGVVVAHNIPPQPAAGSCIFLHVWTSPGHPTSGCTAMELGQMEALVVWLDQSARPLLVQLPKSQYTQVWKAWRLPNLSTNGL